MQYLIFKWCCDWRLKFGVKAGLVLLIFLSITSQAQINANVNVNAIVNANVNVSILEDSLRSEQHGHIRFIVHQVAAGETLFSLSRRYHTEWRAILAYNPHCVPLKIGRLLYVVDGKQHAVPFHVVAEKETLYQIAAQYAIAVTALKGWNGLADNTIHVGDTLLFAPKFPEDGIAVPSSAAAVASQQATQKATARTKETPKALPSIVSSRPSKAQSATKTKALTLAKCFDQPLGELQFTREEGLAFEIPYPKKNQSSGYYALHRKAAKNDFIKVKNLLNGTQILAEVIGSIPPLDVNRNILVQLSPAAYQALNSPNQQIIVEIIRATSCKK